MASIVVFKDEVLLLTGRALEELSTLGVTVMLMSLSFLFSDGLSTLASCATLLGDCVFNSS